MRRQAVLLLTLKLLRPLVLYGRPFAGAALSGVLPACHGVCQALAEVLRQPEAPGLPLQKCPGLQSGRGQGLSSGETSLVMPCLARHVRKGGLMSRSWQDLLQHLRTPAHKQITVLKRDHDCFLWCNIPSRS